MSISPALLPDLITAISTQITKHEAEVTELDQAIGDGDHVFNLQRGLQALLVAKDEISTMEWPAAWQKIGMILMSSVGGASGSLYATLFLSLSKNSQSPIDQSQFASAFKLAIEAVKVRGKADQGEKTMLDVLIPVADCLKNAAENHLDLATTLSQVCHTADQGVEATRDMLATKGRASFLGERSRGHIDAGAKTAQLMLAAIADTLTSPLQ